MVKVRSTKGLIGSSLGTVGNALNQGLSKPGSVGGWWNNVIKPGADGILGSLNFGRNSGRKGRRGRKKKGGRRKKYAMYCRRRGRGGMRIGRSVLKLH